MLCEKCQQQQATVHMQQIFNGEKTEMHLCQNCAAMTAMSISFNNIFQGFLDSFSSVSNNNTNEKGIKKHIKQCSTCGLTYDEFKKTGRLGCSECYNVFSNELNTIFKNVQASNQHQGKFPQKYGSELLCKRELDSLKVLLSKAIENEEYEDAAGYRDKIKELQKNKEAN